VDTRSRTTGTVARRPVGGLTSDITHPEWPLTAGQRWVEEHIGDWGAVVRTEVTVLPDTQTVAAGMEALVVRDVVLRNGAPVSDTLSWYAQDAAGNVWHLGRQTVAYAAGRVVSTAGSWEAGVDGAEPCMVLAGPTGGGSTAGPGQAHRPGTFGARQRLRVS
jgi:hypothetical protein